ncbi:hypothetical protein JCM19302_1554 [Jejuia pallidilutea]|uniref:Uncharacterized protein n=1 Tax=Jejuia pallidilutea TaxID=504487 RepID=A0A090W0U5_9FLAO|nr:hypothetical protein JCM19302_1554 [Jejuia pallidilutea]
MLFLAYYSINYKTYDKADIDIGQLNLEEELEEEIPLTQQIQTPPPHRHHQQHLKLLRL